MLLLPRLRASEERTRSVRVPRAEQRVLDLDRICKSATEGNLTCDACLVSTTNKLAIRPTVTVPEATYLNASTPHNTTTQTRDSRRIGSVESIGAFQKRQKRQTHPNKLRSVWASLR